MTIIVPENSIRIETPEHSIEVPPGEYTLEGLRDACNAQLPDCGCKYVIRDGGLRSAWCEDHSGVIRLLWTSEKGQDDDS